MIVKYFRQIQSKKINDLQTDINSLHFAMTNSCFSIRKPSKKHSENIVTVKLPLSLATCNIVYGSHTTQQETNGLLDWLHTKQKCLPDKKEKLPKEDKRLRIIIDYKKSCYQK